MTRLAVLAVAMMLFAARGARAEDGRIATARAAYLAGEQEKTVAVLVPALPALAEHDRARASRLLGCAHMVLGNRDAAVKAFREAFALEPDAALEPELAASPDARGLYEVARGEWHNALIIEMESRSADVRRLKLDVAAPPKARGGRPIAIAVKLEDPAHLASRVELSYRRRGQPTFTLMTQRLQPGTPVTFAIPADATESPRPFTLDYHVTLRHQTGFDLRRDGSADRPHTIDVSAGHRMRWHESWWVRGAFGLGVVGLGAGGYFLYRSFDVGPQHVTVTAR